MSVDMNRAIKLLKKAEATLLDAQPLLEDEDYDGIAADCEETAESIKNFLIDAGER